MKQEKYSFNTSRLISLSIWPVLFSAFASYCLYVRYSSVDKFVLIDYFAWTLLYLFVAGVFLFLFFNHLPNAKATHLFITGKTLEISQHEQNRSVNFNEIDEILEYSSQKLPWGDIMKWEIKIADSIFIISSLTISQSDLKRFFSDKIKHKVSLIPVI